MTTYVAANMKDKLLRVLEKGDELDDFLENVDIEKDVRYFEVLS